MPDLYGTAGGVNRKQRELYGLAGGTNRKLRELWAKDASGVNRKIFSGAITWTYVIESTSGNAQFSVDATHSAYISQAELNADMYVLYTFDDPIHFAAGDTISANLWNKTDNGNAYTKLYVPSIDLILFEINNSKNNGSVSSTYTFAAPTVVDAIRVYLLMDGNIVQSGNPYSAFVHHLTIITNGLSFILNNSGTSENQ